MNNVKNNWADSKLSRSVWDDDFNEFLAYSCYFKIFINLKLIIKWSYINSDKDKEQASSSEDEDEEDISGLRAGETKMEVDQDGEYVNHFKVMF